MQTRVQEIVQTNRYNERYKEMTHAEKIRDIEARFEDELAAGEEEGRGGGGGGGTRGRRRGWMVVSALCACAHQQCRRLHWHAPRR